MKKYFQLYIGFFKTSIISDLEYRLNIVTKVITDLMWYAAQASVFEVLFMHAPQISGWNIQSARLFMAVLFLVDAFWMLLFQENMDQLPGRVRRGELDLLLAKPVDSQFMLTVQKQNTPYIINIFLTAAYLVWTFSQLENPQWWRLSLLLFLGIPTALAISYSFRLLFVTLSVVFTNADAVNYVWYQVYRLGMRPDTFYPRLVRVLVLTVLPVAFIASVPTRLLMESLDPRLVWGGPVVAIVTLVLARLAWVSSLTKYTSASS